MVTWCPKKIWARSVQPFWRLLDTNKQTPKQPNLYIDDTCSFRGSYLSDLYCNNVIGFYSSWNMVTVIFNLPREAHRYFIEPISENHHLKTMLCLRFVSFFHSLQKSNKIAIRLLSYVFPKNQWLLLAKIFTTLHKIVIVIWMI